ncbi:MAG TPA: acyloxyacyl hydrolase [Candidatus Aquilonibacter sp.]|nr:acyloxyacyl hydrolase [Candidatus Aquilonibacter sp.]
MKCWPLLAIISVVCRGEAQDLQSAGVRGGISLNSHSYTFRQAEAFAEMNLPWRWDFHSDWYFQTRLDASAGWLGGKETDAFIGTIGPVLELGKEKFPLTLEAGFSPTVLSRHEFGIKDFGDWFQFTTHVGLNWDVTKHLRVGYRYQHMSNAGLAEPNPGLNLHMISVSWRF